MRMVLVSVLLMQARSAFTNNTLCPQLEDQPIQVNDTGCRSESVAEKLAVPGPAPDPHNVLQVKPALLQVKRCRGVCSSTLRYNCRPNTITYRNVSVLVLYNDGLCIQSRVIVRDESDCECGCTPTLKCPGMALVNQTNCLCQCPVQDAECEQGKKFDPELCACSCITSEDDSGVPSCFWKHSWSSTSCACELDLSRVDRAHLTTLVVGLLLLISTILNCHCFVAKQKLQTIVDENTTYGLSKHLLREYVKIKPRQPLQSRGRGHWDYKNTY